MLRTSRRNNKISAYEEMEGAFDFNQTPTAPVRTKGMTCPNPEEPAVWQPHGIDVIGTGRNPKHYRLLEFVIEQQKLSTKRNL